MGSGLLDSEPVEQPRQLLARDAQRFPAFGGPTKGAFLQTLVEQPKAVLIPIQQFNLAAVLAAKDEQVRLQRVLAQGILSQGAQALDRFAHVRRSRSQPNLLRRNVEHRLFPQDGQCLAQGGGIESRQQIDTVAAADMHGDRRHARIGSSIWHPIRLRRLHDRERDEGGDRDGSWSGRWRHRGEFLLPVPEGMRNQAVLLAVIGLRDAAGLPGSDMLLPVFGGEGRMGHGVHSGVDRHAIFGCSEGGLKRGRNWRLLRDYYSKISPASKPNRLELLSDIAQQQATNLQEAYTEDNRLGVVKATSSNLETNTISRVNALRAGKFYQESVGKNVGGGNKLPQDPPVPWEGFPHPWNGYPSKRFITPGTQTAITTGVNYEESNNSSSASGTQSATHVDYEYRTPYLEALARNNRAQISLMDQKFETFMFEQNIQHLEQIFNNELASVDNDVYQLQIALLRSFLISPISGIVTGIYKSPGDAVNAGEPVVRVENNGVVHLVANLVHYGQISLGATATVTTTLGGASSPATTLTGNVVAARGQGSGGRWEVVVKVNNVDGSGNYILPLGYCFDAEYTDVTIV